MPSINYNMVITDEAVTYARQANTNPGWFLTPKRWAISSTTGNLVVTRTTDSMFDTWITEPFSGVRAQGTNRLLHSVVIPPDGYNQEIAIGELYFIYEDYYGNEFLFAIAQPTTTLYFTPGVSQSYSFVFALNNTTVADTYTIDYTYPQDIEDHNQKPDSHSYLLARDGSRTATGILSYDQDFSFTDPNNIPSLKYVQTSMTLAVPAGFMTYWPATTPPNGWLERNGAAVSRTTYSTLFSVIGTLYGAGNGSTTFNLPDDRGIFCRAWDNSKGLDPGRVFGSYQEDAIQTHYHLVFAKGGEGGSQYSLNANNYAKESGVHGVTDYKYTIVGVGTYPTAGRTASEPRGARYTSESRGKNRAYLPIIKF